MENAWTHIATSICRPSSCSILLLLMGVADALYLSYLDNGGPLQPIMTQSQVHRVCAELCMSGLGGTPCGSDCVDLVPQGLPLQSAAVVDGGGNSTTTHSVATRYGACDLLCDNGLGYPLCGCKYNETAYEPNYVEVCSEFCVKFDYQLYGCQNCTLYKSFTETTNESTSNPYVLRSVYSEHKTINWSLWCQNMCANGEGGAACNCDLLPMDIDVDI